MCVFTTLEELAARLIQQNIAMAPNRALTLLLFILPDSKYEVEKLTFGNGLHLDREQVWLAIRARYDNLQRQRPKSEARRNAGHAFIADAGNEKFGGERYYPSGSCRRWRVMGRAKKRGRGRTGRRQGSVSNKSYGMKDGNGKVDSSSKSVKCRRCGDDGDKTVRCSGQICGVLCGGKGHDAEIFVNVVSVFACRAPSDDNILSGKEEGAFMGETLGEMSGAPISGTFDMPTSHQ